MFELPLAVLLTLTPTAPRPVQGVFQDPGAVRADGAAVTRADFEAAVAGSQVVLAGEQHDQLSHHLVQLEVISAVHRAQGKVVIGLEMLDRTQQPALDAYLSGATSEAEFAAFWKKAWGFDYALYKPILDYAKANGLKVKALNAPSSVVRQVGKGGLASLTPEQRALIAARVSPITDPRYLEYVRQSVGGHGKTTVSRLFERLGLTGTDPGRVERMIEAMAVWNETMAESVVAALPEGPVVVVVGMGHVLYRAGIGESLRSRSAAAYSVVLPWSTGDRDALRPGSDDLQLADYFRLF